MRLLYSACQHGYVKRRSRTGGRRPGASVSTADTGSVLRRRRTGARERSKLPAAFSRATQPGPKSTRPLVASTVFRAVQREAVECDPVLVVHGEATSAMKGLRSRA
jgi:hypothetical protein